MFKGQISQIGYTVLVANLSLFCKALDVFKVGTTYPFYQCKNYKGAYETIDCDEKTSYVGQVFQFCEEGRRWGQER